MFSVSPDLYANIILPASHWLFAFFALMLLLFALAWHHADRKERRDRFKNLPGAGTVGELVVISGSDSLAPDTWFPVPREGVLGSLRSCDLVVPCGGVRSQHLDFSWQDGTGLLIRPRIGCEAFVDGVPVSRRGAFADTPLVHGSVLQVGSAVLRLQLFSALSHTNRTFVPQAPAPFSPPVPRTQFPPRESFSYQPQPFLPDRPPMEQSPVHSLPEHLPVQALPDQPPVNTLSDPVPVQEQSVQPEPASPRRKRVDRWKEDWSE